jgi:predicted component of type VI protein secretion system
MSDTPTDPEYVLRGVAGMVFGRSYHLLSPTTIGRAPECDICIDSRGISRRHARLRPLEYGVEIEDLKSTNGTYLNGQRVTVAVARSGDEIAFDELRFRVGAVARGAPKVAGEEPKKKSPARRWLWPVAGTALVAAALAAFSAGWLA